jgi:sulfate permease, SulP family
MTTRNSPDMALPAYDKSVTPFRRILVAMEHCDTDVALLRYAAMLHGILPAAEVYCLHVAAGGEREDLRRELFCRVAGFLPNARCEVIIGDTLDAIVATAAADAVDLILAGHSTQGRQRSLARRLAMKAPCSVWMVPNRCQASLRRILVPIDFSRISADTLAAATALAEAAGLDECLALHVHFNDALVTFDEFDDMLAEDRHRAFGIFVAPIDLRGVWVKPLFVDSSHVAATIVRTAADQECDLIVMGTRGRSPSATVLLGSETEHCMMNTPVPLLAIKHFGARLSLLGALRDQRVRGRGDRFT